MSSQSKLEHNSKRALQGEIIIVCIIEGGKVHTIKVKHQMIEIKIVYMLDTKVSHKDWNEINPWKKDIIKIGHIKRVQTIVSNGRWEQQIVDNIQKKAITTNLECLRRLKWQLCFKKRKHQLSNGILINWRKTSLSSSMMFMKEFKSWRKLWILSRKMKIQ